MLTLWRCWELWKHMQLPRAGMLRGAERPRAPGHPLHGDEDPVQQREQQPEPGEEEFQQSCPAGPDLPRPCEAGGPQPFPTGMLSLPSHQGRSEDMGAREGQLLGTW